MFLSKDMFVPVITENSESRINIGVGICQAKAIEV